MKSGDQLYVLGEQGHLDPGVILGYRTSRKIEIKPCRIGRSAYIRSNSVIYSNTLIGDHFETGHNVIVREQNVIGDHFKLWNNSCVDYGCKIGNNVKIHNNVYISQCTEIADDVFIAPGVSTANDLCPICCECMKGPVIMKGARIGVNVTLLPHVIIGENSLVGAGSVVTKDIPPNSLAYGNPARVMRDIRKLPCRAGKREFAYPRNIPHE